MLEIIKCILIALTVITASRYDGVINYTSDILRTNELTYAYNYWLQRGLAVRNEWKFKQRMVSDVLVIPEGPDLLHVVAPDKLTNFQYQELLSDWQNNRPAVGYIRLLCPPSSYHNEVQCVCATFHPVDVNATHRNWTQLGADRFCNALPKLITGTLLNFRNVQTFELSQVAIINMDSDVFTGLSHLQLVRISNVQLSKVNVTQGVLCHPSWNLTSIQLSNV